MRRRKTAEEVAHSLREADHDLAKGLTISDICRKQGIAETTQFRWRQQHVPGHGRHALGAPASLRKRPPAALRTEVV